MSPGNQAMCADGGKLIFVSPGDLVLRSVQFPDLELDRLNLSLRVTPQKGVGG